MRNKRQSKSTGYAIAGLVFGIFGLIFFWLPFVGAIISVIALALATVALIINLQEAKKEILVYVVVVITLFAAALSGKVTYKTSRFVNDVINSGTFQITKKIVSDADIYTDSTTKDVHVVIHQDDLDSANKAFDNLEKIIEELDSTNNDFR